MTDSMLFDMGKPQPKIDGPMVAQDQGEDMLWDGEPDDAGHKQEPETCSHCGQKIPTPNPHKPNGRMVSLLAELWSKQSIHSLDWIRVARGLDECPPVERERTIITDSVVLNRACYGWGLCERRSGVKRDPFYRMTDKGMGFLRGEIRIPSKIMLLGDSVTFESSELVSIYEASNTHLGRDYWDQYPWEHEA